VGWGPVQGKVKVTGRERDCEKKGDGERQVKIVDGEK
jgi:hypothetical protein